jgi:uncharacterized membrane protein YwzB
MPIFKDKIIVSIVHKVASISLTFWQNTSIRYINGEIVAYVIQTEYLNI